MYNAIFTPIVENPQNSAYNVHTAVLWVMANSMNFLILDLQL